jgi:hypothetical protein
MIVNKYIIIFLLIIFFLLYFYVNDISYINESFESLNLSSAYIATQFGPNAWDGSRNNFPDINAYWIWYTNNSLNGAPNNTSKTPVSFIYLYNNTSSSNISAIVSFTADDGCTFYYNGTNMGSSTSWATTVTRNVTIAPGYSLFLFTAYNNKGGAGFIASVMSGSNVLFHTDSSWYFYPSMISLADAVTFYTTNNITPIIKSYNSNIIPAHVACINGVKTWNTKNFPGQTLYWIWYLPQSYANVASSNNVQTTLFKLYNNSTGSSYSATVYYVADDYTTFYFNGNQIGAKVNGSSTVNNQTVTMLPGYNLFSFDCYSTKGPAGLMVSVYQGSTYLFGSDISWFYCDPSYTQTLLTTFQACLNNSVADCQTFYNWFGLSTLAQLGYTCNSTIASGNVPGYVASTNDSYTIASYNSTSSINNCPIAINQPPLNPLKNITCTTYNQTPDSNYPTVCQDAFTTYNLFPSTNPLVIKGNNIYEGIPNTITSDTSLTKLYSNYSTAFPTSTNQNSATSIQAGITSILQQHPLKWGCCMTGKGQTSPITVNERVPINPISPSISPNAKKYNFQTQNLTIPANTCPTTLYNGSTDCNNFFQINCENIMSYMQSQNLNVQTELLNYAPECSCYIPLTSSQTGYDNIPSVCFKSGCTSGSSAYVDPGSKNTDGTIQSCNMTVCTNIFNANNLNATGSSGVSITPTIENNCGSYLPAPTPPPTPTPSKATPTPGTTTPTPSKTTSGTTTPATPATPATPGTSNDKTPTPTPGTSNDKTPTPTPSTNNNSTTDTSTSSSSNNTLYIILSVICILLICSSCSSYFMKKKKK